MSIRREGLIIHSAESRRAVIADDCVFNDNNELIKTYSSIREDEQESILTYRPPGPVAEAYIKSRKRYNFIMGPVGSGKSVASCMGLYSMAKDQPKNYRGYRQLKAIVAREGLIKLKNTVLPTWLDWFRPEIFGGIKRSPMLEHMAVDEYNKIEMQILFVSLKDPAIDIAKLKSWEYNAALLSEAPFLAFEFLPAIAERLGRYPPVSAMPREMKDRHARAVQNKDKELVAKILREWRPYACIWADGNAPAYRSHWFARIMEHNFEGSNINPEIIKELAVFWQPSGLSPEAENTFNLDPDYYTSQLHTKSADAIRRDVHGLIGLGGAEDSVYEHEWHDDHESKSHITPNPTAPVYIGLDFGHTPAAVFLQKDNYGRYTVLSEIINKKEDKTDILSFANQIHQHILQYYPSNETYIYGDPSSQNNRLAGQSDFDILRNNGLYAQVPCKTNSVSIRHTAVKNVLKRFVGDERAFRVAPVCKFLLNGFKGEYRYRAISENALDTTKLEVLKNIYSHVQDALQYALLGAGEYENIMYNDNVAERYTPQHNSKPIHHIKPSFASLFK